MLRHTHMRTFAPVARFAAAALGAILIGSALPSAASAHEHREVGTYEFTVGFQQEPAYQNQPNGIWVQVMDTAAAEEGEHAEGEAAEGDHAAGKPVAGLDQTLKAEVAQGDERMAVALRPAFGEEGVYVGDFIPTAAGDYTFRFTGAVAGQTIDESFTSGTEGENKFSSVEGLSALQFPQKQPSAGELQASLREANAAASQARTLGYVGIGVGALGLLAAIAALLARRGRSAPVPAARTEGV